MRIRPAGFGDLPEICALHIRSWRDVYAGILSDDYLNEGIEADLGAKWQRLSMPDINLVVEVEGGDEMKLAGFAVVHMDHPDGPHLDNFHIDPELRSEGIGHAVFNHVKIQLRMKQANSLWLTVMEENHAARRFYTMHGGKESPPYIEEFCGARVGFRKVKFEAL